MTITEHLLVTTTRAVWLLDVGTGIAKLVDLGRGVYYGISFSADEIFIACRQADVGADQTGQANRILCFDWRLRETRALVPPTPIRDVHQIAFHAGTLFICSTYDDAIVCCDTASASWSTWYPFGPPEGADTHHINSVTAGPDGLLLAGNHPAGWVARFAPDRTPRPGQPRPLGVSTHNVWSDRDGLAVCSSEEGAIRWESGATLPLVEHGWLRGFASDGVSRFVGVSQNRVRARRERSDCMILQLDGTGAAVRRFSFLGFGMLHDMRVLGVADPSHNGLIGTLQPTAWADLPGRYETSCQPIPLKPSGTM